MSRWRKMLRHDPVTPLMSADDPALTYHVRRELLGEDVEPARTLWTPPEVTKLLRRQDDNGSFRYPGRQPPVYPAHHYALLETWKQFRVLVEQYAFTREHPAGRQAAEFLLSCQTPAGDIRGMIANQYATYYTGAILGLLIKAGYGTDPRVERGLRWLLDMRQDDGGWTIPLLTHKLNRAEMYRLTSEYAEPLEPDRGKPFSHNWTGMVLRGFAAHSRHRRSRPVRAAAELLKTRFFQPDVYGSYRAADYWVRFQYPFWWNHLVAALDSLSLIGVPANDPDIQRGLRWLIERQQRDGLWKLSYAKRGGASPTRARSMQLWVTLAICRIFRRYNE